VCAVYVHIVYRLEKGTVGVNNLSAISKRGLLSGKVRTGTYSMPALTGTSSEPGHMTDTSSVLSQQT